MYKIGICGHFGGKKDFKDGQTIKTISITKELIEFYGSSDVLTMDTFGGMRKLPLHLFNLMLLIIKCKNIIILPAQNSLRVLVPILAFANVFFKRKLIYIVIGGWLPKFIENRRILRMCIRKFDYIMVETKTMKQELVLQKITNVIILNNFKKLKILNIDEIKMKVSCPLRLLTFSRVTKLKGIEDAIWVTNELNKKEVKVSLDIYGPVEENYSKDFETLKEKFPSTVHYKGSVSPLESVSVLRNYDVLLFPTLYYTEGIPGTIIDAYSAGVPVIASRWKSFDDVVVDNVTGFGYSFGNREDLKEKLKEVVQNPDKLLEMKKKCINKAYEYTPEYVMKSLRAILKEGN